MDKLPPDLPDHEPPPLEPRNLDDDVSSDDSSVSGHYESEGEAIADLETDTETPKQVRRRDRRLRLGQDKPYEQWGEEQRDKPKWGIPKHQKDEDPLWKRDPKSGRMRLDKVQFACTLGTKQVPPLVAKMSRKRLKYKQRKRKLQEDGDMMLNAQNWGDMLLQSKTTSETQDLPSIDEFMKTPLSKFITFAANDCGYSGYTKELMVNWVHSFFLKAKAEGSKEDNHNWWQATSGPFACDYWKAVCKEIETWEGIDAWEQVDIEEGMHVLESTWAFKLNFSQMVLLKSSRHVSVPEEISN